MGAPGFEPGSIDSKSYYDNTKSTVFNYSTMCFEALKMEVQYQNV